MGKRKNTTVMDIVKAVRANEREQRLSAPTQRAHTFTDRRKEASKKACRKGSW